MTEKRLSFEEYLRRNPMPTGILNKKNYRVIKVKDCYYECHRGYAE